MIAQRIKGVTPSATIELEGTVSQMQAAGIDVIGLNAGEPDFPTPENIMRACIDAIRAGKTKYVSVTGILPLREAICEKLSVDNGLAYTPEEIVVCTGAKQALYNAVLTVCNPGDEVIIPTPCWVSYVEMVKLANALPIRVPMAKDLSLDIPAIEAAISEKTRMIVINTPNNPTGAVYAKESLRALGELAVKHGFYVVSDEVYEKLVYDGAQHTCIAALSQEIREHSIIVNGFSKAYAMTGWRIGYCAAPKEIANGIAALQGHTTSNGTTFVQWAALEAICGPQASLASMREEFGKRRLYLYERLQAISDIRCGNARGAFYLLPDVSKYFGRRHRDWMIRDSVDLCAFMLKEARLAIVPGSAFYAPDCVRIAYSNSLENIRAGMDRMEAALELLQ